MCACVSLCDSNSNATATVFGRRGWRIRGGGSVCSQWCKVEPTGSNCQCQVEYTTEMCFFFCLFPTPIHSLFSLTLKLIVSAHSAHTAFQCDCPKLVIGWHQKGMMMMVVVTLKWLANVPIEVRPLWLALTGGGHTEVECAPLKSKDMATVVAIVSDGANNSWQRLLTAESVWLIDEPSTTSAATICICSDPSSVCPSRDEELQFDLLMMPTFPTPPGPHRCRFSG